MSKHAAEFLGLDLSASKIIVAHLGNGASISAVLNGQCVDTSMGLTPLEGLVMGTRSGDIDPAIMEYIAKKEGLDIAGVMNVLNKKSGVLGISNNLSSDFRDLEEGMNDGNKYVRKMILGYLGYLGITVDEEANKKRGEDLVISAADSKVKVAVIPTNEELAIARETVALV